jgi:hypothetical protein
MDHSPAQPPGERVIRRRGIVVALVGALLIALAVLDGWPVV